MVVVVVSVCVGGGQEPRQLSDCPLPVHVFLGCALSFPCIGMCPSTGGRMVVCVGVLLRGSLQLRALGMLFNGLGSGLGPWSYLLIDR